MTRIAVIIPTLNRADALARTLDSVLACRAPEGSALEFHVVDNGSTDGTPQLLRDVSAQHPQLQIHHCPAKGKSRALNLALARTTADLFVFTDDDVIVQQDWIVQLAEPILRGEADAVGGDITLHPSCIREWMTDWHYIALADTRFMTEATYELVGASMAVRGTALRAVKGFEEALGPGSHAGLGEDSFLFYELRRLGYKVLFRRDCKVVHYPDMARFDEAGIVRRATSMGRSSAFLKHHYREADQRFLRLRRARVLLRRARFELRFRFGLGRAYADIDYLNLVWQDAFYARLLQLRAEGARRTAETAELHRETRA